MPGSQTTSPGNSQGQDLAVPGVFTEGLPQGSKLDGEMLQRQFTTWYENGGNPASSPCPEGYSHLGFVTINGKQYCICANAQGQAVFIRCES